MVWSKLWFFLLAVFAAVVTALLLFQPRPMQSELDAQVEARLLGAERGAQMLIKIHARKWLDAAAQVSSDAQLYEALDQATRGGGNLDLVHKSAQARLRYFNQEWKTDGVIAVDGHGKVLARTGLDEAAWKDDLSGWPVVAEALRGYRLDDTWDLGGKLYRVTASPVIARDRYVGALLVVQEMGTDLATRIHEAQGVEVAFVVRGQVVAQSNSLPILGELPSLVKARGAALAEKAAPVAAGDKTYLVTAAPIAGEAAAHDAAIVLVTERPMATSVQGTLSALSPSMMTPRDLEVVGGGLVAVLLIGLIGMSLEHDRPTRKLMRALQELSRGEAARLDDARHRGRFGTMARAVNATLDRRAAPAQQPRSLDAVLGPPPPATRARTPVAVAPDPYAPVPAPVPVPVPVPAPVAVSAPVPVEPLGPPAIAAPLLSPSPTPAATAPLGPPASPLAHLAPDAPTPMMPTPLAELHALAASQGLFDAPPTAAAPPPTGFEEDDATAVSHKPVAAVAEEAEYHAIFKDFLETKRRCGEPIEGVTYDKFVVKLQQNRDNLMSRYACKSVKFQVYVKDGKAALKATPVGR